MMRGLLALAMVVLFAAGCGGSVPPAATTAASPEGSSGGPAVASGQPPAQPSGEPLASSSTAVPASEAPSGSPVEATDLPVFGSATYVPDTSAAQSLKYLPSDPLSSRVNLTDAAGTFWSLSIPAGALLRPTTITMTPLKTITPAGLPGPILGGVLLEPAGTTFLVPAQLDTYKGPAAKAAILTGDAQGEVRLALAADTARSSVRVDHFSPWYMIDAANAAWAGALATVAKDGDAASAAAVALLKQPVVAPSAPSISNVCPDNSSGTAPDPVIAFIEQVQEPEFGLMNRILASANERRLLGAPYEEILPLAVQLSTRLAAKGQAMLKATKPTADTLQPAMRAALALAGPSVLVNGDHSGLLAEIPPFIDAALADSFTRISKDHDYRQIAVVFDVARMSALAGGKATLEGVQAKLSKALRFKANLHVDERGPQATWAMGGTVSMKYPADLNAEGDLLKGKSTISDITYSDTIGLKLLPKPFDVSATLTKLDVCAGTAEFGVDQFYMDNETYRDDKGGGMTLGRSWINWEFMYGDKGGRDGWTWFVVKLHNGDAQWVDETIQASVDGWSADFSIEINHLGS
jgi:hypothetical protein